MIVSVAHLDDEERALVLGVLLEEVLSWIRTLPGSSRLRALLVFDEVYGFLPPHPANPPTKRPLVALMKQARAFRRGRRGRDAESDGFGLSGVEQRGVVVHGPIADGRRSRACARWPRRGARYGGLQRRARNHAATARAALVVRNAHATSPPILMQPRYAMSVLRGP